jgi:hypothetical protein
MSPVLQRLILQMVQPMVFGGLFLVGMMMTRYPLSFLGAGVVVLLLVVSIARAVWKDQQENLQNEEFLALQRQEVSREQHVKREGEGEGREEKNVLSHQEESEVHPLEEKVSEGESISPRGRAYSQELNECDSNSDLESVFSQRRRLSSTDDTLLGVSQLRSPTQTRNRGNSVESTGSLPYRRRGSSMDSVDSGEFIWRGISQQSDFFDGFVISEESEEVGSNSPGSSYSDGSDSSSSGEEGQNSVGPICIVIRENRF